MGLTDQAAPPSGITLLVAASDASVKVKGLADYVCDGMADEVQIEAALAALPAVGGRVILSEGTFYTATQLDIATANAWMQGQGPQATKIVIGTGLQWGIVIAASYVTLSDLWIYTTDGNNGSYATGTHCVGMSASGLTDLSFRYVRFEHSRDAIKWWGNSKLRVESCYFKDIHNGCGNLGYSTVISQDIVISDCVFEDGTSTSITLNPARNAVITNCILIGNGVDDLCRIDVTSSVGQAYNVLIDNVAAISCGLLESGTPGGGADAPARVVVSNCTALGFWDFPAIQGYFEDLSISNCIFISNLFYAINILQAGRLKLSNVLVDVTGYTTATASAHTVVIAGAPDAQIENLTVIGSGVATGNCLRIASADAVFANSTFMNSLRDGVGVSADRASFVNCRFEGNARYGARFDGDNGRVTASSFIDNSNGNSGVSDDVSIPNNFGGLIVRGCYFSGSDIARHYDEEGAAGDACLVMENVFDGTPTDVAVRVQKTGTLIRNNLGWVTENSGTGSIASGVTADVIAHGLSVTPTVDDLRITLAENPDNTPGAIWVDTIGAANFTVNCENDPGASNLDFGWKAAIL